MTLVILGVLADRLNHNDGLAGDLNRFGPMLAVMATAGLILVADLVVPRRHVRWLAAVAVAGLGAAAIWLALLAATDQWASYFSDSMALDGFSLFFGFLFLAVSAAVIVASLGSIERFGAHQGEFLALMLLSTSGMMLLSGARDLVAIFVALELTSISQYILAGFLRDDRGSEAAIKYLLVGAISSAVLLYGMALLYGVAGTTRLLTTDGAPSIATAIAQQPEARSAVIVAMVFVAAGFGFKMATVPFQMWTPDVYQGAPPPVAAFLSVGSKTAAFAVVIRVFVEGFGVSPDIVGDEWKLMFAVLAAVSMTIGNVMALRQTNIRRMLGYSSIAQAGNFMVGLAALSVTTHAAGGGTIRELTGGSAVIFFLATYAFTNLGAFFAIIAISNRTGSDDIAEYAGLGRRAAIPAAVLAFCLLSLTGLPPTAGFWAKLYIFNAAVQADLVWLVVIAVLNTVLSAFYYLSVARQLYAGTSSSDGEITSSPMMSALLLTAAAGVFAFFVYPSPLIDAAQRAVDGLG